MCDLFLSRHKGSHTPSSEKLRERFGNKKDKDTCDVFINACIECHEKLCHVYGTEVAMMGNKRFVKV